LCLLQRKVDSRYPEGNQEATWSAGRHPGCGQCNSTIKQRLESLRLKKQESS
jgi:hypothetical protein